VKYIIVNCALVGTVRICKEITLFQHSIFYENPRAEKRAF